MPVQKIWVPSEYLKTIGVTCRCGIRHTTDVSIQNVGAIFESPCTNCPTIYLIHIKAEGKMEIKRADGKDITPPQQPVKTENKDTWNAPNSSKYVN